MASNLYYKYFDRIFHIELQKYENINRNNLLVEQQYYLHPNHSTEYAAVKLVDSNSNTINDNKTPSTVLIDLFKAFDTFFHNNLLHKLKFYEIFELEHKLLFSYLSNRKQRVMFYIIQILKLLIYARVYHKVQFWVIYHLVFL